MTFDHPEIKGQHPSPRGFYLYVHEDEMFGVVGVSICSVGLIGYILIFVYSVLSFSCLQFSLCSASQSSSRKVHQGADVTVLIMIIFIVANINVFINQLLPTLVSVAVSLPFISPPSVPFVMEVELSRD